MIVQTTTKQVRRDVSLITKGLEACILCPACEMESIVSSSRRGREIRLTLHCLKSECKKFSKCEWWNAEIAVYEGPNHVR